MHDLNFVLNADRHYDSVLDFGTLEHVFDIGQAFRNVISLCADGGQILHVLPANNQCGHGFFQLSPELFYSLYSAENGFNGTEVFLAAVLDEGNWYGVPRPQGGRRIEIMSTEPLYILVRTTKVRNVRALTVQQSDYRLRWSNVSSQSRSHNTLADSVRQAVRCAYYSSLARKVLGVRLIYRKKFFRSNPELLRIHEP